MTLDEFRVYVVERFDVFYRFVRKLVKDDGVAMDIVQTTVLSLLRCHERIGLEWAGRFFFRSLHNQVISHWRGAQRRKSVSLPLPDEPAPDDVLAFTELVQRARAEMTEEERQVVAAWWDAKGDRREALHTLGFPPSPGKACRYDALLHRAKQKLSAVLGPHSGLRDRIPGKTLWRVTHQVFCNSKG